MTLDWIAFTPWASLAGGVLIGSAAALLVLMNGRIAGITGIVHEAVSVPRSSAWRWAFLAGMALAALVASMTASQVGVPLANLPVLVAAGLLVGVGTRLANGCTSGHGVCGLSRLSPRSMVATAIFMSTAMVTVYLVRHIAI